MIFFNHQVENTRFELVTSCLQGRRSPNWANPPYLIFSTYELFQRSGLKWTLPPQTQVFKSLGLSGLEPPTSRLSGVRSNQLSYKPIFFRFGGHLLSRTVSSEVPSAAWVLTIVFGMGTGVTLKRIATRNVIRSFYGTDNLSLCPSRVQFRAQSLMTK